MIQAAWRGTNTEQNNLTLPPGTLTQSKNLIFGGDGKAKIRRGHDRYASVSAANSMAFLYEFGGSLLVVYRDTNGDLIVAKDNGSGTLTDINGPAGTAPFGYADTTIGWRVTDAGGVVIWTSSVGPLFLDSLTGTWRRTGGLRGLNGIGTLTGSSGFFDPDRQVAYRAVWKTVDANNVPRFGYPSDRIEVVNNTTESRNVRLKIFLPNDATANDFLQVYRSGLSAGSSFVANEEMALVFERKPTGAEVTAGYIEFTDVISDNVRGATIYTAPSQGGFDLANEVPPKCKEVDTYKGMTIYANTIGKYSQRLDLLAVGQAGDATGIQAGDTLTFNIGSAIVLTGVNQEHLNERDFATVLKWTFNGQVAHDSGAQNVRILYSAGLNGYFQQAAADMGTAFTNSKIYRFRYIVTSENAPDGDFRLYIKGGAGYVADQDTELDFSEGTHEIEFLSHSAASTGALRVVAESTTATSGDLRVDNVSAVLMEVANGNFLVDTAGTPAENIAVTAKSIVAALNLHTSNTILGAFYISNFTDFPGYMFFEGSDFSTAFTIAGSAARVGASFSVNITSAITSVSETFPNRLYMSKPNEPHHVPALNYRDIGADKAAIIAVRSTKDRVFVFKENSQIWIGYGDTPQNMRFDPLDLTTRLIGTRLCVKFDGRILAFTNKGVVSITDAGVDPITLNWAVRPEFEDYFNTAVNITAFNNYFAAPYESEGLCLFNFGDGRIWAFSKEAQRNGIYPMFEWEADNGSGGYAWQDFYVVRSTDVSYIACNDDRVRKERKAFTDADFAGDDFAVTISSSSGLDVTLSSASGVSAYDVLNQGSNYARIESISGSTLTLDQTIVWTNGAATIYKSYEASMTLAPFHMGAPDVNKLFHSMIFFFQSLGHEFWAILSNNFNSTTQTWTVPLPAAGSNEIPMWFPTGYQRALWLTLKVKFQRALKNFVCSGIGIDGTMNGKKFRRSNAP